ncbi:hypothetical protein GE061_000805 [Apolygus lucorum]|uniref:Uncharacterized protein n=1 Tax=Apolygus lucorum TaxID=248454 RepID=A0A8S9Y5L2_APOLU|nr:hypothetical protein GE061_000805 [Apolygus lucorum]
MGFQLSKGDRTHANSSEARKRHHHGGMVLRAQGRELSEPDDDDHEYGTGPLLPSTPVLSTTSFPAHMLVRSIEDTPRNVVPKTQEEEHHEARDTPLPERPLLHLKEHQMERRDTPTDELSAPPILTSAEALEDTGTARREDTPPNAEWAPPRPQVGDPGGDYVTPRKDDDGNTQWCWTLEEWTKAFTIEPNMDDESDSEGHGWNVPRRSMNEPPRTHENAGSDLPMETHQDTRSTRSGTLCGTPGSTPCTSSSGTSFNTPNETSDDSDEEDMVRSGSPSRGSTSVTIAPDETRIQIEPPRLATVHQREPMLSKVRKAGTRLQEGTSPEHQDTPLIEADKSNIPKKSQEEEVRSETFRRPTIESSELESPDSILSRLRKRPTTRLPQSSVKKRASMSGRQKEWKDGPLVPDPLSRQVRERAERTAEQLRSLPDGQVNTALPAGNPLERLEEVASLLRYATCSELTAVRLASGQAALKGILELAQWIPIYQRIAEERDALLERQSDWHDEREALDSDRQAAWDALNDITAQGPSESPAAQTTNPVPTEQPAVESPAARTTDTVAPELMSSPLGPAFSPITPSGDRPATPGTVSPNQTKPAKTTRPRSATPPSRSKSPKSNGEEDAEWFPEPCPEPQRLLSDTSSIATRHSLMVRLTRKIKKRTLACLVVGVDMNK